MNKSNIFQSILGPLLTRLGTATAAALVGYGMSVTNQVTVAQAITIVAGVGLDMVVRKFIKR